MLADLVPVLMWMSGPDKGRTWSNRPWLRFVGRTMEEELGDGWLENVHPADRQHCLGTHTSAFDARKAFSMDYRLKRHDGVYRWVMDVGTPLHEQGRFLGYMGSCTDITERKEAEERLLLAMRSGKLGMWDWDVRTDTITWTDPVFVIHGVRKEEFTPTLQGYAALIHADDRERVQRHITDALERDISYDIEFRVVGSDGKVRWVYTTATVLHEGGQAVRMLGSTMDVTDRKEMEIALRDRDERFTRFMQHLPGHAWIKDAEGCYVFINEGVEQMMGCARAEVIGRTDRDLFPPEVAQRHLESDARVRASGQGVETVDLLAQADGLHRSLVNKFLIPDGSGASLLAGIAIDITEQKLAEDRLKEADRRKDEFLATLAHELRNPLAPLRTGMTLLRMGLGAQPEDESTWQLMDRQLDHLVRLIDDLMDMSRISRGTITLRQENVDLHDVVHLALNTVRSAIDEHRHELELDLVAGPVLVQGDMVRLTQVLANLLHNAVKYTDDGGRLRLRLAHDGTEALLQVGDNGMGIPAPMLPHVFEMFTQVDRTLERSKGGLGIGLNIVQRLVGMHNGRIHAESAGEGQGSTFTLHLPLSSGGLSEPVPAPKVHGVSAMPLRILVVDDNRDAADSLALLLRKQGHRLYVAYDGFSALEIARAEEPDAVFLDIGMPGMDGYVTCSHMRDGPWGRTATIWALTGLGQESDRQLAQQAGFDAHFVKPIDPHEMALAIAGVQARGRVWPGDD